MTRQDLYLQEKEKQFLYYFFYSLDEAVLFHSCLFIFRRSYDECCRWVQVPTYYNATAEGRKSVKVCERNNIDGEAHKKYYLRLQFTYFALIILMSVQSTKAHIFIDVEFSQQTQLTYITLFLLLVHAQSSKKMETRKQRSEKRNKNIKYNSSTRSIKKSYFSCPVKAMLLCINTRTYYLFLLYHISLFSAVVVPLVRDIHTHCTLYTLLRCHHPVQCTTQYSVYTFTQSLHPPSLQLYVFSEYYMSNVVFHQPDGSLYFIFFLLTP